MPFRASSGALLGGLICVFAAIVAGASHRYSGSRGPLTDYRETNLRGLTQSKIAEAIRVYDSLGLFSGLSPREMDSSIAAIDAKQVNYYSEILKSFPKTVFETDCNYRVDPGQYARLTGCLAAISRGHFDPEDVVDSFSYQERRCAYGFKLNGRSYATTVGQKDSSPDLSFWDLIEKATREQDQEGRFYQIYPSEGLTEVYLTNAQYSFLSAHHLLEFIDPDMPPIQPRPSPRIVNIVNFIRLLEPRDPKITEDVLYQTVVRQVFMMRKYHLGGTFLLQYDALMDPRYQALLGQLPRDSFEIGAWWEIPQPLVEKAGLGWRGRYPWDWRANVGFSTGYTPAEREKLIDAYMSDFKRIFGYFPKSVGSWFIDAHSLQYMYDKYGIVASCNCKDQYGTDGYTLWGGYWNQAYYPSRDNAYMPAQQESQAIPVPIFRMLGSDPVRQYDNGLGTSRQGVVTLEPVYPFGGGDSTWVNWYFRSFVDDSCLGYNYVQAGQENSFTWDAMAKGFGIQMPLIERLRDSGKIRVETLDSSGRWFRSRYPVTPATSFSVLADLPGSDLKTVWFDSRYYRVNLLWEKGTLRIRDIHVFDEGLASAYDTQPATSNDCQFFTLPVVDGYLWSKPSQVAGLRLKAVVDGKEVLLEGGTPIVAREGFSALHISWPLTTVRDTLEIDLREDQVAMSMDGPASLRWFLDLTTADGAAVPVDDVGPYAVLCSFQGMKYAVRADRGRFLKPGNGVVWRMTPEGSGLAMSF